MGLGRCRRTFHGPSHSDAARKIRPAYAVDMLRRWRTSGGGVAAYVKQMIAIAPTARVK
jgi:hypothetical protein